jgi:hypothetical protein
MFALLQQQSAGELRRHAEQSCASVSTGKQQAVAFLEDVPDQLRLAILASAEISVTAPEP